jgi:hypothetical protein
LFSRVCGSATLRPNNSFKPNATSGVGLILALGTNGEFMSTRSIATAIAASLAIAGQVSASGTYPATSSQLTYSFTCASGPSGQISYSRQGLPGQDNQQLVALVNGAQIQDNARLKELLTGKSVESISAGCEDDTAVIFINTWLKNHEAPERKGVLTIRVDKAGTVTSVDA